MHRFDEVDGLRAVACALVIWHHVADAFAGLAGGGLWVQTIARTGNLGLAGVLAFFAISGYVIPSSLSGDRRAGVARFAVRRFWRLYPPFWFALALTWLAAPAAFSPSQLAWNFTMLPSLGAAVPAAGHFWTLEVEMVFYALVAVLFLILGGLGRRVMLPAFLVTVTWYLWEQNFDIGTHWRSIALHLAVMFWGASCREILRWDFCGWVRPERIGLARAVAVGLITGLLLIRSLKSVYFGLAEDDTELLSFGLGTTLGPGLFLFWVVLTPVHARWVAAVGRWTYSTYLLHAVVFYAAYQGITDYAPGVIGGWSLPVYVAAMTIACFAVGGLAYRWIELPSDRLGKRLTGRTRA